MGNGEKFEGGQHKNPQKREDFLSGGGGHFAGWPEYIPLVLWYKLRLSM